MRLHRICIAAALALAVHLPAVSAGIPMSLYKSPSCLCCDIYVKHLEGNGFKVETVDTKDMASIKKKYNVPSRLEGCHTAVVGGYVVEGLVPAEFVQKMLRERPPTPGLALPGMPVGAPGMPGVKRRVLKVYTLSGDHAPAVYGSF